MSANPSLAEGPGGLLEAQLARESAFSAPGEGCPQASKIGTATVHSPLIEEALERPRLRRDPQRPLHRPPNPFGSLLALYIVVKNPKLGVAVTQAAKVAQPGSGQLGASAETSPSCPSGALKCTCARAGAAR